MCSNDLQDDDLLSTVMSLYPYYTMRADLDRAERLVQSIRASLTGPREKFLPINEFAFGMLAWYRGEFGYARAKMEAAADSLTRGGRTGTRRDAVHAQRSNRGPAIPISRWSHCIEGDLAGADAELRSDGTPLRTTDLSPRAHSAWPMHGRWRS